jgi:hypothetical protein
MKSPCKLTYFRYAIKSIFGIQPRLLAQFISSYPVKGAMPFYRNGFIAIGKYRVLLTFTQLVKAIFFKILDQFPSLY